LALFFIKNALAPFDFYFSFQGIDDPVLYLGNMNLENTDIYDPHFVEELFDAMAPSYEWVNYVTSFGFTTRWRRQCIEQAQLQTGSLVYDFMTGMGECWSKIFDSISDTGSLLALDFCNRMLLHAKHRRCKIPKYNVKLTHQNVLYNNLADSSADHVISAFGLKTFSMEQKKILAREIFRVLKPGGSFSLIEISVPRLGWLKTLFMFYLKRIIPMLGRLFLGNPENYRMLGIYTERFGNSKATVPLFLEAGLEANYHEYFFGCATGISGIKSSHTQG